jgi:predicted DsbA family dithiol-disulfide isomerase
MLAKDMGLDVDKFRACMKSQKARKTLQQDLDLCQRLGLQLATPTFRVKGKVITGLRNKEWWNKVVHGLRNQS